MKTLLIVESPAKAGTIERYLGSDYRVAASYGHIRDLPTKELGIDVDHNFEPKYVITPNSKKTVVELKKAIGASDRVLLATDYDREGEAIAWHVAQAAGLGDMKRITFTEITKEALAAAVKNPRPLDMDLVDSQQARRVLDRLVGYKLSPFLWAKVMRGLSAGRVQSVAVRLIVEREEEIRRFKPEEFWEILANLATAKDEKFQAKLTAIDKQKLEQLSVKDKPSAGKIVADLEKEKYQVVNVEQKETFRYPEPPFTTSTLQQTTGHKLGFSAKKTMKIAQDLYEQGLITYMRTDSTNLSASAVDAIRKYIREEVAPDYLPGQAKVYTTKTKGAQEAHEAIRPTNISQKSTCPPSAVAEGDCRREVKSQKFADDYEKLYQLIWKRAVACQMKPAVLDSLKIDINAGKYDFIAAGQRIKFDGFLKIYPVSVEEKILPAISTGEKLTLLNLEPKQSFTQPPRRYTEASLIKELEEKGIGRPSTYVPIITTIRDRGYVALEKRVFYPQEIGETVNKILVQHFPDIVDIDFTAKMEEELDAVADGKTDWHQLIGNFYQPFAANLDGKYKEVEKADLVGVDQVLAEGKKCPQCGQELKVKMGRYGKFLACSGFPACKYTEPLIIKTGKKCPDCGQGDVIERRSKKGKKFFGCSNWPKCQWASWK